MVRLPNHGHEWQFPLAMPAGWQRCTVHFYRNVFGHVPATKVREVSHMLKAIHAQESRNAADRKARAIVDDLRAAKMHTAADAAPLGELAIPCGVKLGLRIRCSHTQHRVVCVVQFAFLH
jgi:Transposase, Mutator family